MWTITNYVVKQGNTSNMASAGDTLSGNVKYKHEQSGDIREGEGTVVNKLDLCGLSLYREEKFGPSYQVKSPLICLK